MDRKKINKTRAEINKKKQQYRDSSTMLKQTKLSKGEIG